MMAKVSMKSPGSAAETFNNDKGRWWAGLGLVFLRARYAAELGNSKDMEIFYDRISAICWASART